MLCPGQFILIESVAKEDQAKITRQEKISPIEFLDAVFSQKFKTFLRYMYIGGKNLNLKYYPKKLQPLTAVEKEHVFFAKNISWIYIYSPK